MKRDEAPGWSLWSEKKKRSDTQWVSDLFVITRCFVLWINTYRPRRITAFYEKYVELRRNLRYLL